MFKLLLVCATVFSVSAKKNLRVSAGAGPQYVMIKDQTCAEKGHTPITTSEECKGVVGPESNLLFPEEITVANNIVESVTTYPQGCYLFYDEMLWYNEGSSVEPCTDQSNCLCIKSGDDPAAPVAPVEPVAPVVSFSMEPTAVEPAAEPTAEGAAADKATPDAPVPSATEGDNTGAVVIIIGCGVVFAVLIIIFYRKKREKQVKKSSEVSSPLLNNEIIF